MADNYADDKELLISLRQGVVNAFEYIYLKYFDSLLNYADRILHDNDNAKNVVQNVFYKIWENKSELTISISVRAYLFKSVYNLCLNTITHKKYVEKFEQENLSDLYFSVIIQSPEIEDELWRSDIRKAVNDAVSNLPDKCRQVFVLSKIEGLKNREIAEKLNISEKTVERHMSIALSKLRLDLDGLLQLMILYSVL